MKLILASDLSFLLKYGYDITGISKNNMKIGYVINASKGYDTPQTFFEGVKKTIRDNGYSLEEIDIENKSKEEIKSFFKDKNVIHIEGGNTYYLLKAIRGSGFGEILKELLEEGKVYIGTSAGAYIMCPTIEVTGWKRDSSDVNDYGVNDLTSLNYVPFVLKVHYKDEEERFIKEKIKTSKYPLRILRDGQGILVEDGNYKFVGDGEEVKLQKTVKVKPLKPFAFDSTFHKPDHFTTRDNHWEKGIRWQTFNWQKQTIGVKFSNEGTVSNPLVKIKIYSSKKLTNSFVSSFIEEIKYRYNFNYNLSDFYKTFKEDKFLSPILKKWKGMRPGHPSSLYEYLIIGIVLQNASIRRSVQMLKILLEKYGVLLEFDRKKLWCLWTPGRLEKVSEQELRDLKVGYRAKSIKKMDKCFMEGLVDENKLRVKDRETQMEELLKLYGIGPATVWYLLFDVFHHWNFFDHVSPWEQKIYSKLFFNRDTENPVSVKKILKYFEKFGDYKQLAVHYIWEDLWWKRKNEHIEWLEKEIRL